MNGLVFYIGLGIGLALAAGLRPFVPALLAGALASADALGVTFAHGDFHFLETDWWLLAVCVAFALSYALQLLLGMAPIIDPSDRAQRPNPLAAALAGIGIGTGALSSRERSPRTATAAWPGLLAASSLAGLSQRAVWPLILRARARLADRSGARGADDLPRRRLAGGGGARRAAAPARLRGAGAVRVAAARRPPPRRAQVCRPAHPRTVRACRRAIAPLPAHIGPPRVDDPTQARPLRDRRDGTRDARAGGRRGGCAGARRADAPRPLCSRLRRRLSLGDAGVRGVDHHRRRPGAPPDTRR